MRLRGAILAALTLVAGCEPVGSAEGGEPLPARNLRGMPPGSALKSDASPGEVDDALFGHFLREEFDQAYALMSEGYRASVPLPRFRDAVAHNAYLKATREVGCFHVATHEHVVHVRECILFTASGGVHAMLYYERERVGWRLTGMLIGGTPAFPGPGGPSASEAVPEPAQPSGAPAASP